MGDIKADIGRAQIRLQTHRSERSRASAALASAEAKGDKDRAAAWKYRVDMHEARVRTARKVLRELQKQQAEQQEKEELMKHDDSYPAAMVPPNPGWTLRCFRTLTITGKVMPRGSEISPEMLSQCANAPQLISGGHVRWQPPSAPRQAVKAAPPSIPTSAPELTSYVDQLREEMQRISAERGIPIGDCEDLVDHSLYQRALKEYCASPHDVTYGAWGGNPTKTRTGHGSTGMRRIPEGFRQHVLSGVSP